MTEIDLIRGSKGGGKGGGGGSAPTEADNTLFSNAVARVIDAISEGEIVGLLDEEKSIYLDETPVKDKDGNFNFDGHMYKYRLGTNSQSYIEGFESAVSQTQVGVKIEKQNTAVQRSISTSTADAIRVMIYTPGLTFQKSSGDLVGSKVEFKIEMDYDSSGNWVTMKQDSFDGKTTQRYERSYRLEIPSAWKTAGFTSIQVKITRITDDAPGAKTNNDIYWGTYSTVIDNKLRYPNTALIATQFDAQQFSSIPTRGYEIKGVKVRVPSNYTPYDPGHCSISTVRRKDLCVARGGTWNSATAVGDTLYNGDWDGTFDVEWTCNPAWIFYDLCTDERYGLGKYINENLIDKWALYEIAKYCDAVDSSGDFVGVDNGFGGKEARYACHVYFSSREEAYKLLNDIAGVFRGMLYWQEGQITAVQDAPKDPVMTFSQANVIDGLFSYEGTSRKQRHNVAHVQWNNPDDFYRQNIEYVEDTTGINNMNNEIFSTDIIAVGCTSQGQARRVGKWLLFSERYQTNSVTFKTGYDGMALRPGDVINVADSYRSGVRYGGRLSSGSTTTVINLDSDVPLISSRTYRLTLINTEEACVINGSKSATYTTKEDCINNSGEWKPYVWSETKSVDISGVTFDAENNASVSSLTASSAFENTPVEGQMWLLEEVGTVEAQTFQVIAVREQEKNIYEVSAIEHYAGKYALIEDNIQFTEKSTSSLPDVSDPVPKVRNLTLSDGELYVDSTNNVRSRATLSWEPPYYTVYNSTTQTNESRPYPYVGGYYVEYRRTDISNSNWISLGETQANSVTIDDTPKGTYDFRVKVRRIF